MRFKAIPDLVGKAASTHPALIVAAIAVVGGGYIVMQRQNAAAAAPSTDTGSDNSFAGGLGGYSGFAPFGVDNAGGGASSSNAGGASGAVGPDVGSMVSAQSVDATTVSPNGSNSATDIGSLIQSALASFVSTLGGSGGFATTPAVTTVGPGGTTTLPSFVTGDVTTRELFDFNVKQEQDNYNLASANLDFSYANLAANYSMYMSGVSAQEYLAGADLAKSIASNPALMTVGGVSLPDGSNISWSNLNYQIDNKGNWTKNLQSLLASTGIGSSFGTAARTSVSPPPIVGPTYNVQPVIAAPSGPTQSMSDNVPYPVNVPASSIVANAFGGNSGTGSGQPSTVPASAYSTVQPSGPANISNLSPKRALLASLSE
jgi:hypothetical protein